MRIKTNSSLVLREFAEERRRVISDWRILVTARRLARAANVPMPTEAKARDIRLELAKRGEITPVEGLEGVFIVDVPFANLLEVTDEQLIQEGNPWAVFGFLTSLAYHNLTNLIPKEIYAIQIKGGSHLDRIPFGTMPDDWTDDMPPPPRKCRATVRDIEVKWTEMSGDRGFGIFVGYSSGLPIYMTDVERTLVDAIRMPEKCGGIAKVLHAWKESDTIDVNKIIEYTDKYDIQNLRQRVGYLLEKLGNSHPRLIEWRSRLKRGGSLKLVASDAYAGEFSPEWNLSLNVPPSVLSIIE